VIIFINVVMVHPIIGLVAGIVVVLHILGWISISYWQPQDRLSIVVVRGSISKGCRHFIVVFVVVMFDV